MEHQIVISELKVNFKLCGCVYYSTNKAKKITLLKKHLLEQPESPDSNDKCRIQTCVFDDAEQCSVIDLGSFLSLQLKCLSKSNIRILSIEQCSDLPLLSGRVQVSLSPASRTLPAFQFSALDHSDGQFFRAMEWLMFFFSSGHH